MRKAPLRIQHVNAILGVKEVKNMYHVNIKEMTKENSNFREVLYTGPHSQLVVMSLNKGEEIGEEIHEKIDQIFFVMDGLGEADVGEERIRIEEDDVVFVPAGTKHNIKNDGEKDLKLYTIYSPPAHKDGTLELTKKDAEEEEY